MAKSYYQFLLIYESGETKIVSAQSVFDAVDYDEDVISVVRLGFN